MERPEAQSLPAVGRAAVEVGTEAWLLQGLFWAP